MTTVGAAAPGTPGQVPTVAGERVRLRAAKDSDVDDKIRNGRHAEIIRMYGGDPAGAARPVTAEQAQRWVRGLQHHPHAWVIEHNARCIGEIRLDDLNTNDRRARLAVGLQHPDYLGRGLGTDAVTALLNHAFEGLNLHRVGLRVLAFNERAIKAYVKAGFVREGRERESALVGGVWQDDVIMGVLRSDPR